MDWDDARYFLAIAREGQMLSAARRMQVSQARLSRHLATLEAAVGTRLFERGTRGCSLTEAGQLFMETAERVEAEMLSGLGRLSESAASVGGTVRIGAPDGLGSAYLAARLGEIAEPYPDLRLQLVPLPRNFSLSAREADIAIMIGRPQRGRLKVKRLADYSLGLYAAPDYLERHGAPDTAEALRAHRLVGYVEDLLHTPELDYAGDFLPGWRSDFEVSTAIGQIAVVRSGAAIGILHDFMAGDLRPVLPDLWVKRAYWAVWHENRQNPSGVAAVIRGMEAMMRRDQGLFLPRRSPADAITS